ncbi:MAG: stage V sporulation protein AD [Lachnospiraceae bacterium]
MDNQQTTETMNYAMHVAGSQSAKMPRPVYIRECASIVGQKEGSGPLGELFDMVGKDEMFGCKTWEEAESTLQKEAVSLVLGKAKEEKENIHFLLAGDLLGQTIASSFGIKELDIPFFGLFGACSTSGEALALAGMILGGGFAENVICVTSSHFGSAEKEFRFPMEYGGQRPPCYTRTVTGSGAFLVSLKKGGHPYACISGITVGKIVDMNMKDTFNMGCCMAPAAADVIEANFKDFQRLPKDYDKIITGDLGKVGQEALFHLLEEKGYDISQKHIDCGMEMFDPSQPGTESGGSGCGCAASVLSAYILPKLQKNEWNRVLFVPTGALLNKTSYNEGQPILGIAHAIVLESLESSGFFS